MKKLLVVVALLGLAVALFLRMFSAAPLPPPEPLAAVLPAASPPAGMAIFQLPTGVTHRSGAFGYRGGSFRDKRDFAITAVLVKHPRGDLLIDTGFGRDIDTQIKLLPLVFQLTAGYTRTTSAAEQLDAAGYDRANLRGILLTHAHWDHTSGIPEFPGTPILVTPDERAFIRDGGFVTVFARSFSDVKYEEYSFESGPYLGFPKSHDIYGDGSIVIVPAPGHTPGSVVVFLTLPDRKRYAMLGDLVWQREGISLREERPWPLRRLVDSNEDGVRENLLRVSAIATKFPEIILVPAHDLRGFAGMPLFERAH